MEIHGPFSGDELPEEAQLMVMVITHDFCMSADSFDTTSKPTPAQYNLSPGDAGFCTKSDSMVDNGFCAVQVVDPQGYADMFPDWGDRIRNGYVLTQWIHVDDRLPHAGWFSRAKIVPLPEPSMFDTIAQYISGLKTDEEFNSDDLPFLDPAYRKLLAEQLPQNEKDAEALLCGSCRSSNVVVRVWHNTFLETTGSWRINEEGERKLVRASIDHQDCTFEGEIACYDCGWSRTAAAEEFEGWDHHDS